MRSKRAIRSVGATPIQAILLCQRIAVLAVLLDVAVNGMVNGNTVFEVLSDSRTNTALASICYIVVIVTALVGLTKWIGLGLKIKIL